jgi:hypothetical protein
MAMAMAMAVAVDEQRGLQTQEHHLTLSGFSYPGQAAVAMTAGLLGCYLLTSLFRSRVRSPATGPGLAW